MRIALVTDWFAPRVGGIESHVRTLARRLRGAGLRPTVLTNWPGPDAVDGVDVRRLGLPLAPRLGVCLAPVRMARTVRGALRGGGYDVVHAHMSFGSTLSIASAWAAGKEGIPVLVTFHTRLGRLAWIYVAARPVLRWRGWPFHPAAVSEYVAGDLRRLMPDRDVGLLPPAVEPGEWTVERTPTAPARLRVVTTSRLHRRRRVDVLLSILRRVRDQVSGTTEVTLEIMGDGPARNRLERDAERLGLSGCVRFLGEGRPDDVRALLARADVYVNPCDREAFGIAALEAVAAGVPVVALRTGGVSAFVRHGENGLLAPSHAGMAAALVRLAREPDLLSALRDGAGLPLPADLTWDGAVKRHITRYEELLTPAASPLP